MCGITGILYNSKKANSTNTERACSLMRHRGPDEQLTFTDDNVSLGHCRLSIIDTSSAANQPMKDSTGRYTIVYNGEIFNFESLKSNYLADKEINFLTHSDTEVLLYLLIHFNTKCLEWLDGFFAFALYDNHNQSLLLARDRFGKKPLLYYNSSDFFAFSSELKALLAYDIKKELNPEAIRHYFQFTYVPPHECIFQDIIKLPPGSFIYVKQNDTEIRVQSFFSLKIQESYNAAPTYDHAQNKLIELLDNAVVKRLISDVPLGAFLSGGIDSSAVVALASRHTKKLNTFSIGYKDNPFFDETSYAKLVSKKFKTEHTVFSISNQDFLDNIEDIFSYIDEPFADSSSIPLYILCKLTRSQNITVALSGDGGDEVFAGYNKHYAENKMRHNNMLQSSIKHLSFLWQLLPKGRSGYFKNKFRQLDKLASTSKLNQKERFISLASFNHNPTKIFSESFKQKFTSNSDSLLKDKMTSMLRTNDFNEFLSADIQFVLVGDMLVKLDSMSMANSLEVRSPFLDKDVVDFAFSLPSEYKIDNKLKKKIVQDSFQNILPIELYNRPKKGFEIPLIEWLKNELWHLVTEDGMSDDFIKKQGIFNLDEIRKHRVALKSNDPGDSYITIWSLIAFQYWYKKYFM